MADFDVLDPLERCNFFGVFDDEISSDARYDALASALQNAQPCCSPHDFDPAFADVLYRVWRMHPFTISSGFRLVEYERSRSRTGRSSHCKGLAADIVCLSNLDRFQLVSSFLALGVTRIGIAKNFIHVDMDFSKPSPRIWTYDDNNNERKG